MRHRILAAGLPPLLRCGRSLAGSHMAKAKPTSSAATSTIRTITMELMSTICLPRTSTGQPTVSKRHVCAFFVAAHATGAERLTAPDWDGLPPFDKR
jgi:hypothetical protein